MLNVGVLVGISKNQGSKYRPQHIRAVVTRTPKEWIPNFLKQSCRFTHLTSGRRYHMAPFSTPKLFVIWDPLRSAGEEEIFAALVCTYETQPGKLAAWDSSLVSMSCGLLWGVVARNLHLELQQDNSHLT